MASGLSLTSQIIKNGGFLSYHINTGLCLRIILPNADDVILFNTTQLPLVLSWIMSYWNQEKVSQYKWSNLFQINQYGYGKIKLIIMNKTPNSIKKLSEQDFHLNFIPFPNLVQELKQSDINLGKLRQICYEYYPSYFDLLNPIFKHMHINRAILENPDELDEGFHENEDDSLQVRYIYYGIRISFSDQDS